MICRLCAHFGMQYDLQTVRTFRNAIWSADCAHISECNMICRLCAHFGMQYDLQAVRTFRNAIWSADCAHISECNMICRLCAHFLLYDTLAFGVPQRWIKIILCCGSHLWVDPYTSALFRMNILRQYSKFIWLKSKQHVCPKIDEFLSDYTVTPL